MTMGSGHASMPGMAISTGAAGTGATQILPSWLAVVWMVTFASILVIHVRHAVEEEGERRLWHCGHVLMALGMALMYAPASIDRLDISSAWWQLVFGCATLAIFALTLGRTLARRAISPLWPLMAIDMAAMAYMWSSSGLVAPLTWLLVTYFLGQSVLWARDWIGSLDEQAPPAAVWSLEGGVAAAAAAPLICHRDLRISMSAMTLGMAYMLAAVQLAM
ncbi:MAG: DUF5134 domain-containing protein [Solirubrobacteraceae bacterium]